jgi:hypothetical protein
VGSSCDLFGLEGEQASLLFAPGDKGHGTGSGGCELGVGSGLGVASGLFGFAMTDARAEDFLAGD